MVGLKKQRKYQLKLKIDKYMQIDVKIVRFAEVRPQALKGEKLLLFLIERNLVWLTKIQI